MADSGGGSRRQRGAALRRARWALIRELPTVSRPLTVAAVACMLAGAALPAGFAVATGVAVEAVSGAVEAGFGSPAGRRLAAGVAVVGALFALSQMLQPVEELVVFRLARRMRIRTYQRSIAATLRPATIAHLEDPALQDLVSAATILSPNGPASAVRGLLNLARRRVAVLGPFVLIASFQIWAAALLLAAELAFAREWSRIYRDLVAFRVLHLPGLRRAVYVRTLALAPAAAKETRTFGLEGWVEGRFRETWLGTMREIWASRRGNFVRVLTFATPVVGAFGILYWTLGRAAIDGSVGVGTAVACATAAMATLQLAFGASSVDVEEGATILAKTGELEDVVRTDPRLMLPGTRAADELPTEDIRFVDVSFAYPGGTPVLDHLDLTIPAGRSLAIVGVNGAGKTTLVKLLARLYDPAAGRILVGDVDLRDVDPSSWQRRVSAVFQDFVRYPLSVADNIALGSPADPDALCRAARRAGALQLIESLPNGWNTLLGRQFDGGVELSGGEWQRIALARALYAAARGTGLRLLVLDEPTAHLDARAEAEFFDSFFDVTAGCTTVVISHRFSTVRRAERIVVLDGGRIVESGSHDELVALGGRYAAMFTLQASRFAAAQAPAE
ncbi:MAG TPA: ABC transporter ATP-binding protein [Acidimicrobiales bacterium]